MKKGFLSGVFKNADMPGEIMFDVPFIAISGDFSVTIENYLGIISYEEGEIKINTKSAIIKITGDNLSIGHITDEVISVSGKIESLSFI